MRFFFTLTWLALLLAAGCAPTQRTMPGPLPQPAPVPAPLPPPVVQAPARIGLLLPLSGAAERLGQDLSDAAQLALFDVGATDLELLPRDTGDTPEQAVAAARSALDAGAELLIGPLFGRSTTAVAPVAAERNVNVLSFSNDASIVRPGVFVLGYRPEEQIERVVGYAARQGLSRIAALAPNDAYGTRAIDAWRTTLGRIPGARPVASELYAANQGSPSEVVRRVASVGRSGAALAPKGAAPGAPTPPPGFDALLIADGGARVRSIVALLAHYGIEPATARLLGTMRWQEDPTLLRDPAMRGAWFASWPANALESFAQRFSQTFGRRPTPLAVLAYDATALAALMARGNPRFTNEQLLDPQGFIGRAGIFRLLPDGLAQHALEIVEVTNGATRVVDPAPVAFDAGIAAR